MSRSGLLIFAGAYALATFSPGPGVAAFVARVLARGRRGVWEFIAGFVIGDLVWFAFAAAGLAALAQTYHAIFAAVKWAGVAYLLYLAGRLWTASGELGAAAEPRAGDADDRPLRLLLASLSLTLGNPKPMVFFMALLPTLVDLPQLTLAGALQIALVIVVVMSATLVSYTLLAERARRLLTDARQVRVVNRVCGSAIAGAAVAVAQQ